MSLVSSDALAVGHDVPDLHRAIVTCTQKEVPCLWEELDPLYGFIVARPGVQPFLRYEAIMVFVPQVGRCLDEALVTILAHRSCSVIDCFRLEEDVVLVGILDFGFLKSFLSLLLIRLHEVLLLICKSSALLRLEFFHTFVDCPRSFEVSAAGLTELLPLHFHLFSFCFPRSFFLNTLSIANHQRRSYAGAIRRVHCHACVIEPHPLLIEPCSIQLCLL